MNIQTKKIDLKGDISCQCITIKNENDAYAQILTLGGIVKSIYVPDKDGKLENILLEYENINTYANNNIYLNSLIGRTSGRIYKGEITIKDTTYTLTKNNNGHTLHGGLNGLDKKIWNIDNICDNSVKISTHLEHLEDGYPAYLNVTVVYSFSNDNTFSIEYSATASDNTIVNLTNHMYFNLSGNAKSPITEQRLKINSDYICEIDNENIVTGKLLKVSDYPAFNFKKMKKIGQDIDDNNPQIINGSGYDHPFLLEEPTDAIHLYDKISGRNMIISTSENIAVVYSMNSSSEELFTNGKKNIKRYGICFETQKFPIGYNQIFKNHSILKIGNVYRSKTSYKFFT